MPCTQSYVSYKSVGICNIVQELAEAYMLENALLTVFPTAPTFLLALKKEIKSWVRWKSSTAKQS